jgi:parallel beta-helix repeat protein
MPERQHLQRAYRLHWVVVGCFLLLALSTYLFASAESLDTPAVTYDSTTNLIALGNDSGFPTASQVLTIPELATALASQGHANLLVDQGSGHWLLKASILIKNTARLEATNATLQWLRLDSPPLQPVVITAYRGGHLHVNGIKVTSWDSIANTVDENTANQRSYLLALQGGRMDILSSDVGYLGWESGEASGLSWRERLTKGDATTGATGRLEDSQIHHNYFGMYSFEAYGLTILRNRVFDNIYYGIDPHDYSEGFETAYNIVYNNGNHGIIFSRHCIKNNIHHNEVYNNNGHGIMLDRGTNQNKVYNNLIYNNKDGIAIFQSSDNEIYDNTVRNNERGVRVNATFDTDDIYDGISTNNKFTNNTIEDSKEYGVYLYARADRNIFTSNTILRSGVSGFYIKTGGNRLEGNVIRLGALGVSIVGGDVLNLPSPAAPALEVPGDKNVVLDNTITNNNDTGLRILGASYNRIGSLSAGEKGNRIEENGRDGMAIGDSSTGSPATNNQILGNSIKLNVRHGILINDLTTVRNRVSQNSIARNGWLGIKVATGAQGGIQPPVITSKPANGLITGTAQPNVTIEVYNDAGGTALQAQATLVTAAQADESLLAPLTNAPYAEGAIYLGSTTSNGNGAWSFQVSGSFNPDDLNALAIDQNSNTSAFSNGDVNSGGGGGTPTYTFGTDANNQKLILVNGVGATVTLADIQAGVSGDSSNHLVNLGNGIWRLNTSISIGSGVTLNLTPEDGVKELQLRSEKNGATPSPTPNYDYTSFVFLRTYNGTINIARIRLYSWDNTAQKVDEDYNNGRAYLLAKYVAVLNIHDAEISYLGSGDGESYGISWRDINDTGSSVLRTRVTGDVVNSDIHHNYYGIYTFQASDMLFQGNKFHHNVRYGFDPHDYTHTVLVENNSAYSNGAHGFIISRGCNNFIIRNNKAYDNLDNSSSEAHGFMLDPGSPTSADPQAPSYDNVLENNEAYNNEGFGLRILGSINNQIVNNYFHHNQVGISVDDKSTGNQIQNNRLEQNREHGLILLENANNNTVLSNQITGNNSHGLYLRSNNNLIRHNAIQLNRMDGVYVWTAVGNSTVQNNQIISNTIVGNLDRGLDLRKARQTLLQDNLIADQLNHGVYLSDGSFQNSIFRNIIRNNGQQGIRAVGAQTYANTWSQNQISGNKLGGVLLSQSANGNLTTPAITTVIEQVMTGNAPAGATIEIFADGGNQGQFYVGQTVTGADGNFTFTAGGLWPGVNLAVIAIDNVGNTSTFSIAVPSTGYRGGTNATPPATGTATGTPVTPLPVTVTPGTPVPETPTPVPSSDKVHLPLIRN